MAITLTARTKEYLEEVLTLKGAKVVQKRIKAVKNNSEDVFITTNTKYGFDFFKGS